MASYDDIVKKNKDYLTQAQINALASASQEYNIANAGNRAGALQDARQQYDASYRGLQNMGLAGNPNAAPTSGEVPRLQMQIKTPLDSYNDRLKQVEHQRLGLLGEQFKQETIAQREAEAAARRAQAEAMRRAQLQAAAETIQARAAKIGTTVMNSVANNVVGGLLKGFGSSINLTQGQKSSSTAPAAQYSEPIGPATKQETQEEQQRRQQYIKELSAAKATGIAAPNLPEQIKSDKATDSYKSAVVEAALNSRRDPATAWKATSNEQKQFRQVANNSASFLTTGQGFDIEADKKALTDAQNRLENLKWTRHYGGKVSSEDYKSAQDAVSALKLKVEQPETYASLVVYNDPTKRGTPAYDKAVGIVANEEAKAMVKKAYGRDIDTSMTFDEYEQASRVLPQVRTLVERYDREQKTLDIAKENKLSDATIAKHRSNISDIEKELAGLGYTVDQARSLPDDFATERDVRAELEYYRNALAADMRNDGKKPTKAVNKDETDVIYRAVNDLPDIMRKKDRFVDFLPGSMSNAAFTDQSVVSTAVQGQWMKISQINAYNYLYETQGIDAANAYLDSIRPLINIERARQDTDYASTLANDKVGSTILANLGSIPLRATGSIPAALEKLIVGGINAHNDMLTGGTGTKYYLDTNDAAHRMANIASTIRSETSQRILDANQNNPTFGNFANKAYQIGMSTADSGFNMAFGVAGLPWVTGLLASSDAANETYKDVRARGGTQEQAMSLSCLSAIAEGLFERVSLEYFTNNWIEHGAAWTRPFIVKWGLGAGVEGSEEVFTSVANMLSDIYVMHDKSEWKQLVQKKGMKRALFDEIKNIGGEGVAGFISGGVFGLFGGAYNAARSYSETTNIGKQAESLGLVQKYKDMAAVLGGKADTVAMKADKKPTAHNVGKMVTQVNQQLSEAFTGKEQTDIPMALLFSGKQLSFTEANAVYQALGSEELKKMGYDAEGARPFMESYNKRMVDTGIFSRMQEQLKKSNATRADVEAEEYLTMTDQLGGTTYNEKNVALQKAMRESLEKRVWKNPNAGVVVTDTGDEITSMPGNMTRVGWAEMNRKNFQAQSTVTKGRTTYELSSMAMRDGMTNDESYAAMRDNMQDAAKKSADFYEKLSDSLGLDIVVHDVMRGSNGFLKDGKLHVVLSSRQNAVRIASHELTHYMKAHSPEKFTKLVDNLIREVGQKEFDRQVTAKAAFYGFDASTRSGLANAREEVVAELCERMLSNEDMLARFAQRETATARAMKSHLEKTVEAIRNALTGDEERDFGNSKSSMIKAVETMDSWIDGLTDAIANAEAQQKTMMGQVAITAGVTEADHNRLIDKLSETKTEEEFDEVFTEFSVDVIEYDLAGYMQDLLKNNIMSAEEVTELFDTMINAIEMVKAHRAILDFGFQLSEEAQNDPDLAAKEIAEAKANRPYMPYKQNADPHYKMALDFSTLCKKRILLQMIQERLQGKLGRALSALETIAVRREIQKLQRNGVDVEVACALCYVEAARLKSPKVINEFLGVGLDEEARARNVEEEMKNYFAQKDKDIKKDIEKAQKDWKVKKLGENWRGEDKKGKSITAAKATKDHLKAFGGQALVDEYNQYSKDLRTGRTGNIVNESLKANQQKVIRDAVELVQKSPETFLSAESLAQLKLSNPDIFYAFTNKVRSATRSKALETDTFYSRGDISMFEEGIIRAANNESGFRHQSWSDFMPIHLLDTMASIIEMSQRGAKMHAYTKVADMVRLLGNTGMMLNLSLIPAGETGLDASGNISRDAFDSVEGMDFDTMLNLRDLFPDTVGNIAIGITDEQIQKLLASDMIDYVIPYHVSGLNKELRKHMGIHAWLDFTSSQNESVAEGKAPSGKSWKEEHKARKMKPPALNAWFDEKAAKAAGKNGVQYMQQAAQKYLDICARDGWVPKFSQYLDYDEATNKYTTKSGYENYWKTLIDRKMVNHKTGEVIIQQAVKPKFNQDTVMSILSAEASNPTAIRNAAAADEIAGELGKTWRGDRENANLKSYKNELKAFQEASAVMAATRVKEAVQRKMKETSFSIDDEYMDLAQHYADGTATEAQKDRLQQMVGDASSRYIEGFILPDDTDEEGFKFHRGPAPTKTFKRYAVLNVTEDGFKAAYAGNRTATPVGPWLDAQNLVSYMSDITKFRDGSYATYIKGDTGAAASDKFSQELLNEYGLKASQSMLLERGGKHSSDLPNFSQMNLQRDENGNKIEKKYIKSDGVLPHNKLIFEIEYGVREGGDLTDYVREHGRIDSTGKNQGIAKIGPNQYYDFKTNPNAVGNWGIGGTFRIRRLVTMDEVQRVTEEYKQNAIENAKKQYADGKISRADMKKQIAGAEAITTQKWEGGLHPEDFGLTVESVDNMFQEGKKMKLGDLVTYDDDGNIIPLSQRFNPNVEDARYSIEDEDYYRDAVEHLKAGAATQEETEYIWSLAEEAHQVGAQVQRKLDPLMDDIVSKDDFLVGKLGAEKSTKSIVSKIKRKPKDPLRFGDLARGCFLVESYEQPSFQRSAQRTVYELQAAGVPVIEVDDKFAKPNKWGYRGLHIGVTMDGITCELQFATKEVWDNVKTPSEEIYAKWRDRLEDVSYDWSEEELRELAEDKESSVRMWEEAVEKYHLPERVDIRFSNSSQERDLASQVSQGSFGATQAPSTNSAYGLPADGDAVQAKNLPSYSMTPSDLLTSNMAVSPLQESISQVGDESNTDLLAEEANASYSIDPETMELPSLHINDREQDFTGEIMRGEKTIETRTYPIPKALVGKWVPIIRTGKGAQNNAVVGYVKFSGDKAYNNLADFRADYDAHKVDGGSYDFRNTKYGWIIEDVKPLDNPIVVGKQGYTAGEQRFRDLGGIIDNPNTMFSIDDETPSRYSDERIAQFAGVSEFLDQISKGDRQLRERLLTALMPVIEANVTAAEKRATEARPTARQAAKPGMKPPRENRVRDVDVPRQARTGDPVSDFVSNFLSSNKASDEIVAELDEKIQNGEWGTYAKLTNAEAVQRARDYISRRSVTQAQSEFHDMVASGRFNVHTRALGLQLLAEAAARGDKMAVLDIASDLRELATDAGQSVQIFNVLNELGGLGSAWHMQRKIDQLNSKYAQEISDGKMNEITVDPDLMQALIDAKTTEEISKAEDEVAKAIARQLPLTWGSRISNWRYLAMLGNPTTHFRNITGNVFMATLNTTKDAVAAGLEKLAVRDTNERTHALLTVADRQMWGDFVQKSYESSEKALRGSGKFGFETQLRQYMRSFDTKWLNKLADFNFSRLEDEDVWFIRPAYKNALMQYMKAQGYTLRDGVAGKMAGGRFQEITSDKMNAAIEWASNQAWKATFRDASAVADMLNTASRRLGPVGNVLIEGVMPFKKTPVNIAKRGIEYSPAGIIMGLVQLNKDVRTGKVTKANAIDNIASGIVGSALMALGAALAKAGFIRAGGDDKKKVETYLTDTGEQTYSLKFGDVSIDISALAPSTIPLFMGAALFDALDKSGEGLNMSALTETMASTLNPFMEMSVMSSLNNALKNYNSGGIGGALGNTVMTAVESYGSQFLPTAVGKFGQLIDKTNRTTKSSAASPLGSGLDYYGRSLVKKIPGATKLLQPDINVWGRETTKDTFGKWALDFFNKFLSPVGVKVSNKDAVDDELIRLVESTGNVDILPSDGAKKFTVGGESYPMTAAQYTEFSRDRGQASYAALKETMLSSAYQQAGDEEKAEMLQNALAAAQKQVNTVWKENLGALVPEDTAAGDYSDPGLYKVAAYDKNAYDKAAQASAQGVSPDTFLSLLEKKDNYLGDDRSDYVRKEIMNSNLTREQKDLMDDLIVSKTGRNPDYSSQAWFDISSISEAAYNKAKSVEKLGVKPETYLSLYNKQKSYTGEGKTNYMRNEIMKMNLSAKQKAALDDAIISDKDREIDYSSKALFELSLIGKDEHEKAKTGEKVGVKPEVYLKAYNKKKEVNAKDKDGNYINTKKEAKKLLKEYLDSQPISAPAYDYIWMTLFGYKSR